MVKLSMDEMNIKPLRNMIQRTRLKDGLYVTWAYSNQLSWLNSPQFPKDIETSNEIITALRRGDRRWINEPMLTFLAYLIVLYAQEDTRYADKSALSYNFIKKGIDKYRDVEPYDRSGGNRDYILGYMKKSFYSQFPYQVERPSKTLFAIFAEVYSSVFSMYESPVEFAKDSSQYSISLFGILAIFMAEPRKKDALEVEIELVDREFFNLIYRVLISDIDVVRCEIKVSEMSRLYFDGLLLVKHCLIMDKQRIVYCPSIPALVQGLTTGFIYKLDSYLKLINPSHDSQAFFGYYGKAFEEVFLKHLDMSLNVNSKEVIRYPEEYYVLGKNKRSTIDLLLDSKDIVIFGEIKTWKISNNSKFIDSLLIGDTDSLKVNKILKDQYFELQIFLNGGYEDSIRVCTGKPIYVLCITVEPMYALQFAIEEIVGNFKEKHTELSDLVDKYPPLFISYMDALTIIPILLRLDYEDFFNKLNQKDHMSWYLYNFIEHFYPEEFAKQNRYINEYFSELLQF